MGIPYHREEQWREIPSHCPWQNNTNTNYHFNRIDTNQTDKHWATHTYIEGSIQQKSRLYSLLLHVQTKTESKSNRLLIKFTNIKRRNWSKRNETWKHTTNNPYVCNTSPRQYPFNETKLYIQSITKVELLQLITNEILCELSWYTHGDNSPFITNIVWTNTPPPLQKNCQW